MSYPEETQQLSAETKALILAAYAILDEADFIEVAPTIIASANMTAASLADVACAALIGANALGISRPDGELERLDKAIKSILKSPTTQDSSTSDTTHLITRSDEQPVSTRLARIARAEPLHAGRETFREAMVQNNVSTWTRQANPDACEACKSLDDGSVRSTDEPFFDHPACACIMVPIIEEEE